MVEYHCELCSYSTNLKPHYERHCKTKKHNLKVDESKKNKDHEDKNYSKITPNYSENYSKLLQITPKLQDDEKFKCQICQKQFTRKYNLERHIIHGRCKITPNYSKLLQNESKMNPNESKMNPNESKMNPNESKMNPNEINEKNEFDEPNYLQPIPNQQEICDNIQKENKKYQCFFCKKYYSTNSNLKKHISKCKLKISEESNNKNLDLMEDKIKELKDKNVVLANNFNNLTNNIQNLTKINTQNNSTINYLNIHFNNVQPIEIFLENLKNKFQLSNSDRKCLLNTYNECGIEAFADTFSIIMKKNLKEQIHQDLLPTIPIVCTDSNLRSIKEYHKDGWKATQSNSNIDKMIDISNEQIYESENTKMFISQKERKKIYTKLKKDNTILAMEEIKKKNEKLNDDDNQVIEEEESNINKNEIDKEYQFINDDLIEKNAIDKLT